MTDVSEVIAIAYYPYDVVLSPCGSMGFIDEVNINRSQSEINDQLSYSVKWFHNVNLLKSAWWKHEDLTVVDNIFRAIAKNSCHPMGRNSSWVDDLMTRGERL